MLLGKGFKVDLFLLPLNGKTQVSFKTMDRHFEVT